MNSMLLYMTTTIWAKKSATVMAVVWIKQLELTRLITLTTWQESIVTKFWRLHDHSIGVTTPKTSNKLTDTPFASHITTYTLQTKRSAQTRTHFIFFVTIAYRTTIALSTAQFKNSSTATMAISPTKQDFFVCRCVETCKNDILHQKWPSKIQSVTHN